MARPSPSIEIIDLTADDDDNSIQSSASGTGSGGASLASDLRSSLNKPAPLALAKSAADANSTTNGTEPAGGSNSQYGELPHTYAYPFINTQRSSGSSLAVANNGPTPESQRALLPSSAPSSGFSVGEPIVGNPHGTGMQNGLFIERRDNVQSSREEPAKDISIKRPADVVSKDTETAPNRTNNEAESKIPTASIGTLTPIPPTQRADPPSTTSRKRKESWSWGPSESPVFRAPPSLKWVKPLGPEVAQPPVLRPPPRFWPLPGPVQPSNPGFQSVPVAVLPKTDLGTSPALVSHSPKTPASFYQNEAATTQKPGPVTSSHGSSTASEPVIRENPIPYAETGVVQAAPQVEPSVTSESPTIQSSFPPGFDRGRFPQERRRRGAKGAPNPFISKGHHKRPYRVSSTSEPTMDASMSSTPIAGAGAYRKKESPEYLSPYASSSSKPPRTTAFEQTFGSPAGGNLQSSTSTASSTQLNSKPQGQSNLTKSQNTTNAINTEEPAKGIGKEMNDTDIVFDYFKSARSTGWHHDGYTDVKKLFSRVVSDAVRRERAHYKYWPIDIEETTKKAKETAADWASKRFGDFVNHLIVSPTSIPNSKDVEWLQRKVAQTFFEAASFAKKNASIRTTEFGSLRNESYIPSTDLDLNGQMLDGAAISNEDSNFKGPLEPRIFRSDFSAYTSTPAEELDPPFESHKRNYSATSDHRSARLAAKTAASRIFSQYQTGPIAQKDGVHPSAVSFPKRLCPICNCMISIVNTKVHLSTKKHQENARHTRERREQRTEEAQNIKHITWPSRPQTPAFALEIEPKNSILTPRDENPAVPTAVTLQARKKVVQGAYNVSLAASLAAGDPQMSIPYRRRKARGTIGNADHLNLIEQSQLLQHVDQQAKSVFTMIESREKDPNLRPSRCIGSLLRHRELGSNGVGRHVETGSELKIRLSENIKPWRSFKGASHDVVSVAWAPNSMSFGAGAVTHSNSEDLQYNRPCNLLFGDLCNNTLRELPDHRVDRQMPQTGRNMENQDLFNACDPKVYKTVTSIKFHPQGNLMYTASEDETVKIWELSKSVPQCVRTLRHDASVTSLDISYHQPTIFATASQKTRNAIRVFGIAGDQETLTVFSSSRAELKPEWKVYPECLQWGSTSHTSHLLLGGFQEYEREVSSENEGHLCLWDAYTAQDLKVMPASQAIHAITWHPTSPYFASGGAPGFERTDRQNTKTVVRVWDLRHIKRVAFEYECQAREMTDVTFSPIDDNIVTAGCTNSRSYVWDCRWPLQPLHELCHGDSIMPRGERDTGVMMSLWGTGSSLYYTGSSDGSIRAWDIRRHPNDVLVHTVTQLDAGIQSGAFSPDGTHLLVGDATGGVNVLSSAPWLPHPSESTWDDIGTKGTPIDIIRAPDGSGAMKADDDNPGTEGIEAGQTLLHTGQLVLDPVYGPGKGPNYDGPYAMDAREEKSGNEVGLLKQRIYLHQPFSHGGYPRPEIEGPIRVLAAARKELLDKKHKDEIRPGSPQEQRDPAMDQYTGKRMGHMQHGANLGLVNGSGHKTGRMSSNLALDSFPADSAKASNTKFTPLAKHSHAQSQPWSPLGMDYENFVYESEMEEELGWWPRLGEEEIAKAYARPNVRMG